MATFLQVCLVVIWVILVAWGIFYEFCFPKNQLRHRWALARLKAFAQNHGSWCNDWSDQNLKLCVRAARLFGICPAYNSWWELSDKMSIRDGNMMVVQNELGKLIAKSLGADIPDCEPETWYAVDWNDIAERLEINHLRSLNRFVDRELPVPFVMYAFCELFPYIKGNLDLESAQAR